MLRTSWDGGQVFVQMDDDASMRLGHATMDIRYHQGIRADNSSSRAEFDYADGIPGYGCNFTSRTLVHIDINK